MIKKIKKQPAAAGRKIQYLENDPFFAKQKGYNPILLSKIQPAGNMRFDDPAYMKIGSYYIACLHVLELPSEPGDFWLQGILNIDQAMTVIDIGNMDMEQVKYKLDRSITELETRKSRSSEQDIDTANKYQLLLNIQTDIVTNHEQVKDLAIRLYVHGGTRKQAEANVEAVKLRLRALEFQAEVLLNEQEYEYRAMMQPQKLQLKNPNHRQGFGVPSYALSLSWPFNNEDLLDPHGIYLGDTDSGGKVCPDVYQKTAYRKSYDVVVVGTKGSGKSTLLKLLMKNYAIRGNYIRVLDCTGEFTTLAQLLGGTVVSMDGASGRINCTEVFAGMGSDSSSFAQHLSKLNTIYKLISPDSTDYERNEFEEYVRKLYQHRGIYDPLKGAGNAPLCGRPPEEYPKLSDLLHIIQEDLYADKNLRTVNPNLSPSKRERLEHIELTIGNLVNSYPELFNCSTSLPDITNRRVVVYNVQNIANMKDEIFQAMMFNILNLMLTDVVRIGGKSKEMYEQGSPAWEVPKLMLIIDEAHRFINTRNQMVLDFMSRIVSEGRKFFTSLVFASQSIRDFAPEAKEGDPALDKLKRLFELVQYKFIMQQDTNATQLLHRVFGDGITDSQLSMIPQFKTGEAIFLTGEQNLHMAVVATPKDLVERFKGGA